MAARRANGIGHGWARTGGTTGEMLGQCFTRHRHGEPLSFLKVIDREVARGKSFHIVLGNHATRKHENVAMRMAEHKRFHMRFRPSISS